LVDRICKSMWLRVLLLALAFLTHGAIAAAQAPAQAAAGPPAGPEGRSTNVAVSLLSERATVRPGDRFHLAVRQRMDGEWHTYWRNPGDSGEATRIDWTLGAGASAGPILWPAPTALPFGPLVNYGYSGEVILPVVVDVPAYARPGQILRIDAAVDWLECADVCIPASAVLGMDLPIGAASRDGADAPAIRAALAALPRPLPGPARLTDRRADGWLLSVALDRPVATATFFPHELKAGALIDHPAPQVVGVGDKGLAIGLRKSPSAPSALEGPVSGVLRLGEGPDAPVWLVEAAPGEPLPDTGATEIPPQRAAPKGQTAAPIIPAPVEGGLELPTAMAFAFLGGLLLNLMPCVFPILSMKALSLAKAAHGPQAHARRDGLLYGAGVMAAFLALGGLLAGLGAAGQTAGWGFQLQSPPVLVALVVLMSLIGFNLLGMFEVGGGVQGLGAGVAGRGGAGGAFFTGVLAVVVAAPCTAPFMGAALGFAAVQPPLTGLSVFGALAAGFALPFVALAFSPFLQRALPKPGPWMIRFKEFLAFPMFATAIWLVWVLAAQAGQTGVLSALIAVLGAGFAVWLGQVGKARWTRAFGLAVALIAIGWSLVHVAGATAPDASAQARADRDTPPAEPWSPERVEALRAEGRPVFVNFTADWCVTCKVNEAVVFSDPKVAAAFRDAGAAYLIADWTSRDAGIAQALSSHGRIGVPLYLYYAPQAAAPLILPQVLTPSVVADALAKS
jgi:thiol:disulfide interchange protein DsbD